MSIPTLQKTIDNVLEEHNCLQKLLIGGILMFVPIVNIFSFGLVLVRACVPVRAASNGQVGGVAELVAAGTLPITASHVRDGHA